MRLHEYQITPTSLLPAVAIALAAGIFVADTTTESEIAFPVFYTAIVLIAARFCTKRGIIFVGLGCIGLILLSDILTIDVSPSQAGIANTAISVVAIAATTYLAAKIQAEKETAYHARSQLAHVVRVTTLGEMTTSIAHQINQPLAAMAVHSNACLNWLEAEPPNLDEARKILHASSRMPIEPMKSSSRFAISRRVPRRREPGFKSMRSFIRLSASSTEKFRGIRSLCRPGSRIMCRPFRETGFSCNRSL